MPKRIFMVYENENTFRELTEEEAYSCPADVEEEGVPVEVEEINGVTHLTCLCYYSSSGVFKMQITRPAEQAVFIFMKALGADSDVEAFQLFQEVKNLSTG